MKQWGEWHCIHLIQDTMPEENYAMSYYFLKITLLVVTVNENEFI